MTRRITMQQAKQNAFRIMDEAENRRAQAALAEAPGAVVELAKRIPFQMVMHVNCGKEHHLDYLNRELNLACLITTPYRNGQPGKGVKEFGINERAAKSYKTLAALLKAHPAIAQKAAGLYPPNEKAHPQPVAAVVERKGDNQ
jgi:hypothetical protein